MRKRKFWRDFVNQNKAITIIGIVALIYCMICVLFKSSTRLNVNVMIYSWGEFFFNIAISLVAAVIFFIIQVYIPNKKGMMY